MAMINVPSGIWERQGTKKDLKYATKNYKGESLHSDVELILLLRHIRFCSFDVVESKTPRCEVKMMLKLMPNDCKFVCFLHSDERFR
jgi:hypothetical protein